MSLTKSTWSPRETEPNSTAAIAAIPDANALHASPRSRSASLASKASTVGFWPRE